MPQLRSLPVIVRLTVLASLTVLCLSAVAPRAEAQASSTDPSPESSSVSTSTARGSDDPSADAPAPSASAPTSRPASADPRIAEQLERIGIHYEVDSDGDYQVVIAINEQRTHLAYIMSSTETFRALDVRVIWAVANRMSTSELPADLAQRLLRENLRTIAGSWAITDDQLLFTMRIPADADDQTLLSALEIVLASADRMEQELTDGADEF
ncbi:MAG: YbjN domain-containing protein [Acidobacteriota bacterium]